MAQKNTTKSCVMKPLPSELRSIVRSGIAITNMAQCVEELVLNSIDAGSKTVNILVDIELFNVRVDDDGAGLSEKDLEAVGNRYTTSKCQCLEDLNRLKYYGYRGEALASIIDVSGTVDIITRPKEVPGIELKKKFDGGKRQGHLEKHNTSQLDSGTTVIVGRLLSKLPVRQRQIDKSIQLEEIKKCLEKIALMKPSVNIELKNEKSGNRVFTFQACNSYSEAFDQLFQSRLGFQVNFIEEDHLKKNLFLSLSTSKEFSKKKHFQFVYVNNRFIARCKIHKWVGLGLLDNSIYPQKTTSSPKIERYPIFILNITCPLTEYDITLEPKKQLVEFKDWAALEAGIDGLITKLKARNNCAGPSKCNKAGQAEKSAVNLSSFDIKGALHSKFVGRDVTESEKISQESKMSESVASSRSSSVSEGPQRLANRNLSRTGANSHVVDIRGWRRKRKMDPSEILSKSFVPPKLNRRVDMKPKIMANVLKRFPEFKQDESKDDTKVPAVPPKKTRIEGENSLPTNTNQNSDQQHPFPLPPATCKSSFSWKINNFLNTIESDGPSTRATPVPVDGENIVHRGLKNSATGYSSGSNSVVSIEYVPPRLTEEELLANKIKLFNETVKSRGIMAMERLCKRWDRTIRRKSALERIREDWDDLKITPQYQEQQRYRRKSAPAILNVSPTAEVPDPTGGCAATITMNSENPPRSSLKASTSSRMPFAFKPSVLQEIVQPSSSTKPPPLKNLLPVQKTITSDWDDKMLSEDYTDDSDLFPSDLSLEIVMDAKEQEWLRTSDVKGRTVYINLSTGEPSYDMVHVLGSLKTISVGEMKKTNPNKYSWLRKHFPRGYKQFWDGGKKEVTKAGDFSKIQNSLIQKSIVKCAALNEIEVSKWRKNEVANVSQYFNSENKEGSRSQSAMRSSQEVEGLPAWKAFAGGITSFRFSQKDFSHFEVIGQYDRKFILATLRQSFSEEPTLVIFDQHAVHERIRLEKFVAESWRKSKSTGKKCLVEYKIVPSVPLILSEGDIKMLRSYSQFFHLNGLRFELEGSSRVKFLTAPKCFMERATTEAISSRENFIQNLVHKLVQELVHRIWDTRGACPPGIMPTTVHNVLCSQACHGAIKFGDPLDTSACKKLISDLATCKNPFQCAHGRPSVIPLIKSSDLALTKKCEDLEVLVRPLIEEFSSHIGNHQECSEHFCTPANDGIEQDLTASSYFSKPSEERPQPKEVSISKDRILFSQTQPFSININSENQVSQQSQENTQSRKSSLVNDNDIEDDDDEGEEDSPYFLNLRF